MMNAEERTQLVHSEIQYRWPSLAINASNSSVKTADDLALVLADQMGFAQRRAVIEARDFWNDLEEKLRRAVTE